MQISKIKQNTGFTLVETLVAISILSISILGTFTAVQKSLQSSYLAKDQTVAFFLIQETMEYIRNIRDENALNSIASISAGGSSVNWLHGITEVAGDPCYFGKVCKVDVLLKQMTDCSGSCPVLNQDSSSGAYGYTSGGTWSASKFKREITLTQVPGTSDEIIATITVSWANGLVGTKTIQVKENLLNIR